MKITELDLFSIGFKKVVVSPEEAGDDHGYYYWEYELSDANDDFCLITMENTKIVNDDWWVKLFQVDDYVIKDRIKLRTFIETILSYKNL